MRAVPSELTSENWRVVRIHSSLGSLSSRSNRKTAPIGSSKSNRFLESLSLSTQVAVTGLGAFSNIASFGILSWLSVRSTSSGLHSLWGMWVGRIFTRYEGCGDRLPGQVLDEIVLVRRDHAGVHIHDTRANVFEFPRCVSASLLLWSTCAEDSGVCGDD